MTSELAEATEATRDIILEQVGHQADWIKWAALSSMVMALFAAIGALFASMTANDAVLERTQEILEVSYLENDRLRVEVLRAKREILNALASSTTEMSVADEAELARLGAEIAQLQRAVEAEEAKVQHASDVHTIFAIGITLLSVAITLTGMAIIARRKFPWLTGLVLGIAGCGFVIDGLLSI